MSLLNNLGAAHDLTLHHHILKNFSPEAGLHDDTGGGAAEGEADGDHGGPALLPALLLAPRAPLRRVARAEILALGAELRLPRLHILLVLCEQISCEMTKLESQYAANIRSLP